MVYFIHSMLELNMEKKYKRKTEYLLYSMVSNIFQCSDIYYSILFQVNNYIL